MTVFVGILFRYVSPAVLVVGTAASVWTHDTASISASLGLAALWFFSNTMRVAR